MTWLLVLLSALCWTQSSAFLGWSLPNRQIGGFTFTSSALFAKTNNKRGMKANKKKKRRNKRRSENAGLEDEKVNKALTDAAASYDQELKRTASKAEQEEIKAPDDIQSLAAKAQLRDDDNNEQTSDPVSKPSSAAKDSSQTDDAPGKVEEAATKYAYLVSSVERDEGGAFIQRSSDGDLLSVSSITPSAALQFQQTETNLPIAEALLRQRLNIAALSRFRELEQNRGVTAKPPVKTSIERLEGSNEFREVLLDEIVSDFADDGGVGSKDENPTLLRTVRQQRSDERTSRALLKQRLADASLERFQRLQTATDVTSSFDRSEVVLQMRLGPKFEWKVKPYDRDSESLKPSSPSKMSESAQRALLSRRLADESLARLTRFRDRPVTANMDSVLANKGTKELEGGNDDKPKIEFTLISPGSVAASIPRIDPIAPTTSATAPTQTAEANKDWDEIGDGNAEGQSDELSSLWAKFNKGLSLQATEQDGVGSHGADDGTNTEVEGLASEIPDLSDPSVTDNEDAKKSISNSEEIGGSDDENASLQEGLDLVSEPRGLDEEWESLTKDPRINDALRQVYTGELPDVDLSSLDSDLPEDEEMQGEPVRDNTAGDNAEPPAARFTSIPRKGEVKRSSSSSTKPKPVAPTSASDPLARDWSSIDAKKEEPTEQRQPSDPIAQAAPGSLSGAETLSAMSDAEIKGDTSENGVNQTEDLRDTTGLLGNNGPAQAAQLSESDSVESPTASANDAGTTRLPDVSDMNQPQGTNETPIGAHVELQILSTAPTADTDSDTNKVDIVAQDPDATAGSPTQEIADTTKPEAASFSGLSASTQAKLDAKEQLTASTAEVQSMTGAPGSESSTNGQEKTESPQDNIQSSLESSTGVQESQPGQPGTVLPSPPTAGTSVSDYQQSTVTPAVESEAAREEIDDTYGSPVQPRTAVNQPASDSPVEAQATGSSETNDKVVPNIYSPMSLDDVKPVQQGAKPAAHQPARTNGMLKPDDPRKRSWQEASGSNVGASPPVPIPNQSSNYLQRMRGQSPYKRQSNVPTPQGYAPNPFSTNPRTGTKGSSQVNLRSNQATNPTSGLPYQQAGNQLADSGSAGSNAAAELAAAEALDQARIDANAASGTTGGNGIPGYQGGIPSNMQPGTQSQNGYSANPGNVAPRDTNSLTNYDLQRYRNRAQSVFPPRELYPPRNVAPPSNTWSANRGQQNAMQNRNNWDNQRQSVYRDGRSGVDSTSNRGQASNGNWATNSQNPQSYRGQASNAAPPNGSQANAQQDRQRYQGHLGHAPSRRTPNSQHYQNQVTGRSPNYNVANRQGLGNNDPNQASSQSSSVQGQQEKFDGDPQSDPAAELAAAEAMDTARDGYTLASDNQSQSMAPDGAWATGHQSLGAQYGTNNMDPRFRADSRLGIRRFAWEQGRRQPQNMNPNPNNTQNPPTSTPPAQNPPDQQ